MMFQELKPLLANRSLTITVVALDEEQIRVNVIPHSRPDDSKVNESITYSHKDQVAPIPDAAVKALTTPVSLSGTAEEIDANLADVLLKFVEYHRSLQDSCDRAGSEISEAVKAIDERNKNKSKPKTPGQKAGAKEELQLKPGEDRSKPGETLPLWWTTGSVAPPEATSSHDSNSPEDPVEAPEANNIPTNPQEENPTCQ
jgi:PRTRC genetic system protein E